MYNHGLGIKELRAAFSEMGRVFDSERLANNLKELATKVSKMQLPTMAKEENTRLYTTMSKIAVLGEMASDTKALLKKDQEDEEDEIKIVYESIDLTMQPESPPSLESLVNTRIRKLFTYTEDGEGNPEEVRWCEGLLLDAGISIDGTPVGDVQWDEAYVEDGSEEEEITCEEFPIQDWNMSNEIMKKGLWGLA